MSWFSRLKNTLGPRKLADDLADEMADHLERRTAQLSDKGLSAEDAGRQARIRFGNPTLVREESRGIRLWSTLEGAMQDVRYAWRGMRKSPVFTATAVSSLALAIGANTAIYSIIDAAILRPLPVSHPEQLFLLASPGISDLGTPEDPERDTFSYPEFLEFCKAARGVARLGLFAFGESVEAQHPKTDGALERVNRAFVSGEVFDMLGVGPAVGRLFSVDEDRLPPGRPIAVLSYEYWRRRFHSDPAVVGQWLKIQGKPYEITGVVRNGFSGIEPGIFVDVWLPATQYDAAAFENRGWHWFRILGRFSPGTSAGQVKALLQPPFHRSKVEIIGLFKSLPPGIRKQLLESDIRVHPAPSGASQFRQTFSRPLWIVFGVAAGILLIACANVASLLLARSTARAGEMGMRVSLGAGRMRLIRQMLTESLSLSLLAGSLGWVFARITVPLLVRLLSLQGDPARFDLAVDTRVLAFCVTVSTIAAVLFGLIPAWQASDAQPMSSVRATSGSTGKLRLGKVFLGIQATCAFCLVLVGASFVFSLVNLFRVGPGLDPHNVAVLNITTETQNKSDEAKRELMRQIQQAVAGQSNMQAAIATWPIFELTGWSEQVVIPGKGPSQQEEIFYSVSPGYFTTLRTPLLAGRDFSSTDSSKREVDKDPASAIVNEAFARKYFGAVDVVGREFSYPFRTEYVREVIVGVASNAHYFDLRRPFDPIVYLPIGGETDFTMYVRSGLSLGSLEHLMDREMKAVGSGMRVREITSLDTIIGGTLLREKLLASLGGAFAFFGLLLAGIGLFGVLSYSVGRRTREIGIRAALGAQRVELVSLVLAEVATLIGAALAIGLAAGLTIMTVFRSLLFGIQNVDPAVIGSSIAVFVAIGLLASGLPARRAATIDPIRALREE